MPHKDTLSSEPYFRQRVGFLNADGSRGWGTGVRILARCPGCGDQRGKAWLNIYTQRISCFRGDCSLHRGSSAVAVVCQLEGGISYGHAQELLAPYQEESPLVETRPVAPVYTDWCRLPSALHLLRVSDHASVRAKEVAAFLMHQWRVSVATAQRFRLGFCTEGRWAWRVIISLVVEGQTVAFQGRSYRGAEPKYRTSRAGPATDPLAECGRPASAILYNVDCVQRGAEVILVEGAGDVLHLAEQHRPAVALLGQHVTSQKIALLRARRPRRVIVALDADPEAQARGRECVSTLRAWDLPAVRGTWEEGKDAGAGGRLVTEAETPLTRLASGVSGGIVS